jgi:integrase
MAKQIYEKTKATGVYKQHARGCAGGMCSCHASYQASVYSVRDGKSIRKTFATRSEAELWRGEMRAAVKHGKVRAPSKITVAEAAKTLLAGMKDGTIENRSGRPYKPSTIRRYELALNRHLLPEIGRTKLSDIDRERVKRLVQGWRRADMVPSSVRNNLDPLRVIIREAIDDGNKGITIDPMAGMMLPQGSGRRERVADRAEAAGLIAALPESERALWGCAFYGGLRRGELRGLECVDLDFEAGVIRVERGWDDDEGAQDTKSDAGKRAVPIAATLRRLLVAHALATGRRGQDLVFGRTALEPFIPSTVRMRALKAWGWKYVRNTEGSGPKMVWTKARENALEPIGLHEARHSAASYLIEAGLNDLELTAMIGHSDPRTTKMIYGHLFKDSTAVVTAKLDAYHEAAKVGASG